MASAMLKRTTMLNSMANRLRSYASVAVGTDLVSAAPNISLQKARTWDEGVSSKFSTTPLKDIFRGKNVVIFGLPGAYTGVCSAQHVPSYKNNIDKLKAKGVDSVICVSINDPYVMNGWAEKLQAKDAGLGRVASVEDKLREVRKERPGPKGPREKRVKERGRRWRAKSSYQCTRGCAKVRPRGWDPELRNLEKILGPSNEDARDILKLRKEMEELKRQIDKDGSFGPTVEIISPFTARVMKAQLPRELRNLEKILGPSNEDARDILKLRKEMEELKRQIDKDGSFGPTVEIISPFTARVMKAQLPRGVKAPEICYKGVIDPNDHLAAYQTHMLMRAVEDEIQCRLFVGTLEGPAVKWFLTLSNGTIDCFKDLAQLFLNAYEGRFQPKKHFTHLFSLKQKEGETNTELVQRWNEAINEVEPMDDKTSIALFMSVLRSGELFRRLDYDTPNSYKSMMARVNKFCATEESDRLKGKNEGALHKGSDKEKKGERAKATTLSIPTLKPLAVPVAEIKSKEGGGQKRKRGDKKRRKERPGPKGPREKRVKERGRRWRAKSSYQCTRGCAKVRPRGWDPELRNLEKILGPSNEDARDILKLRKEMEELKRQIDKDGSFGPTVEIISPFTARVMKAQLPRELRNLEKILGPSNEDARDILKLRKEMEELKRQIDKDGSFGPTVEIISPFTARVMKAQLPRGTLEGPAVKWFLTLPNGTIDCFKDLAQLFLNAYGGRFKPKKHFTHLFSLKQKEGETNTELVQRWNEAINEVEPMDDKTSIALFMSVLRSGELFRRLDYDTPTSYKSMMARVNKFCAMEESDRLKGKNEGALHKGSDKEKKGERAKATTFSIPTLKPLAVPVAEIKSKEGGGQKRKHGDKKRRQWPYDPEKYCNFHRRPGHATEECQFLKKMEGEMKEREPNANREPNQGGNVWRRDAQPQQQVQENPEEFPQVGVIFGGPETGVTSKEKRDDLDPISNFECSETGPLPSLLLSPNMKKTISKVFKIFNGGKKSKEDESVSSITPAQLGEMRGTIPPDYEVQEAMGTTLERNPNTSRRLIVHYDSKHPTNFETLPLGKAIVPSSIRPNAVLGPSTQETGSSSSSQARHKRGRNSTPLLGSLASAGPSMGTADQPVGTADHFLGTAGDGSLTGQGSQPFPYAREAYQYAGYTAWVGRDFNNKLQEIQQFKKDHRDVIQSPAWPFMQEEYTRMADYVATSSAQRHSLRLLDRNAALSRELRDFKSWHSICVERPEYDRVLSENDQLYSDRERLAAKVGQRDLNRVHDLKEMEFLRRDLERQVRERDLQLREEAKLH
ncbi:unnamed protein product [Cuscuta campestris]|uniref:glutaredoxin-dependent peroxiredoxin n=1 Tax=Cuscuta campestris TaxID=132261 RepID=A0A484LTJ7_9ASTE|nr:unnamed protein product [Cuscuta campestris]